jgi:hypothetical protein
VPRSFKRIHNKLHLTLSARLCAVFVFEGMVERIIAPRAGPGYGLKGPFTGII